MTAPTKPAPTPRQPDLPPAPRQPDPPVILPRHPGYAVTALAELFRHALENLTDAELSTESRRTATLPPSPLAAEMRHLVDAEVEYRIAQRRADADALVEASRVDRAALERAAAEARWVSGATFEAVA